MWLILGWVTGGFVLGWIASDVYKYFEEKGRWR